MDGSRIVLANSYKARIIAEAQVKTGKVKRVGSII